MQADNLQKYATENLKQEVAVSDEFSLERYRHFIKKFPKRIGSGILRVLDVGCAEGRGGKILVDERPNVMLDGLDCVEERLAALPDCYSNRLLGLTDNVPIDDRCYDIIVAGEFLEHLYPRDVDPTLCEFQRILKIGGLLLMTTPNPRSINMRRKGATVYGTAHLTQHHSSVLRDRLRMHGFSRVHIEGTGRMSRYIGTRFPWLDVYGSYLISALKI